MTQRTMMRRVAVGCLLIDLVAVVLMFALHIGNEFGRVAVGISLVAATCLIYRTTR